MCKVAILENYSLFSSSIEPVLLKKQGIDVVGVAKNIDDLLLILETNKVDVIVFDVLHSENDGIKTIKKLKRRFSRLPVLLILSEEYANYFEEYIALGVKGFLFKDSNSKELFKAIKKLCKQEEYFRNNVWTILRKYLRTRKTRKFADDKKLPLTNREISIMRLFCKGLSYKEIGVNLNISPRTVETHKRNIQTKLNLKSTAELVQYAINHHLLN